MVRFSVPEALKKLPRMRKYAKDISGRPSHWSDMNEPLPSL
jgi:hypothetical protein